MEQLTSIFVGLKSRSLRWLGRYLRTWSELIAHPFTFIRQINDANPLVLSSLKFAGSNLAVFGVLVYCVLWVFDYPLYPPSTTAFASDKTLFVWTAVYLVIWIFTAVLVRKWLRSLNNQLRRKMLRKRLRADETPRIQWTHLYRSLIYMVSGPISLYALLAYSFVIITGTYISGSAFFDDLSDSNFVLLSAIVLSLGLLAIAPFFIGSWMVARALRSFYTSGFVLGVFAPTLLFLLVFGTYRYVFTTTDPNKMSTTEREALRRLIVLGDAQTLTWLKNSAWANDLQTLTKEHYLHALQPPDEVLVAAWLGEEITQYQNEMNGYRFHFRFYRARKECVLFAEPLDYGPKSRLSFGISCDRAFLPRSPVAEDAKGDHATWANGFLVRLPAQWEWPEPDRNLQANSAQPNGSSSTSPNTQPHEPSQPDQKSSSSNAKSQSNRLDWAVYSRPLKHDRIVEIRWNVAQSAGFDVYRSETPQGAWKKLNSDRLPSSQKSFRDEQLPSETFDHFYKIVAIGANGETLMEIIGRVHS